MSPLSPRIATHVSLRRLFPQSSFVGCADIQVTKATHRSSECLPGELFAAIRGARCDGAEFVAEAVTRGADSVLVQQPMADVPVPQCVVPNVRRAYALLCSELAGYPSKHLQVAGVTGTNGKTTVTWLLRSIFESAGKQSGLLGTIQYDDGVETGPSQLTTPDSQTISLWLARMVQRGTTHAAMELSSHALDQDRPTGTQLDVAVVTNVTRDHLDYHQTVDSYLSSKTRIIEQLKPDGLFVLNADDAGSMTVGERVGSSHQRMTYGLKASADVWANILHESLEGTRFELVVFGERVEISTPLVGRHNVSNCLAAAAAARHFGLTLDEIRNGIESLPSVPGRLERVDAGQPFDVFVDYAHTDDALRNSISSLASLSGGRLICLFGAGGDRDRSKRPLLGQAAAEADLAVVTSDNSRSEEPRRIIADILPGFTKAQRQPHVEPDRADAIRWALGRARPGDCVLIAGKGDETYQIVGAKRFPFDDRTMVRTILTHVPWRAVGKHQSTRNRVAGVSHH